jgi:indolepyruvate ferredoxin oxidoreductase beta subunit
LASKLLGRLLLTKGYDIKVSEVHGMSQRGGSVVTYVRFGDKVYSPVIDLGQADFIVSFELLEAARWTTYLKPGGKLITNTQQINPMPVIIGAAQYPENLAQQMVDAGIDIDAIDALTLAEEAGSSKAVNLVLMGRLSRYFDFTEEEWLTAIEASVPAKFLEMNKKAFALGRNA